MIVHRGTIRQQQAIARKGQKIHINLFKYENAETGEVFEMELTALLNYGTIVEGGIFYRLTPSYLAIDSKKPGFCSSHGSVDLEDKEVKIFDEFRKGFTLEVDVDGEGSLHLLHQEDATEKVKKNQKLMGFFEGLFYNYISNTKDIPYSLELHQVRGTDEKVETKKAIEIAKKEVQKFIKETHSVKTKKIGYYDSTEIIIPEIGLELNIVSNNKLGTTVSKLNKTIENVKHWYYSDLRSEELVHLLELNANNEKFEKMEETKQEETKQTETPKQTVGDVEMTKNIREQIKQLRRDSINIDVELLEVKDSKTGEDYVLILDVNLHHLNYKDGKLDLSNSFNEVRILPKNSNILNATSESFYNKHMQIFKNLPYRTSIDITEGSDLMEVLTKYINEKLKNNNKIMAFFEDLTSNYLENIKDLPEVPNNKDIEGTDKIVKNVTARKIVKNEFKNFGGDDASVTLETVKDYRGINQTIAKVNNGYPKYLEYKKTLLEDNKKGTTEKDLNIFINKLKRGYIKLLKIKELYNLVKLNENTENFRKCEKLHKYQDGKLKQEEETKQASEQETPKQETKQEKQRQQAEAKKQAKRQEAKRQEEERQAQKQQAETKQPKQQETEDDVKMEKMEDMMALVQTLAEQNKQAIAKIEQLEAKIEDNKPFYKKIADKVKEVKDASVAKVKEVKDASVAKVKEVTVGAVVAIIPQAVKEEIRNQGNQAQEVKQEEPKQEKQETPKQQKQAEPKQKQAEPRQKQASEQKQQKQEQNQASEQKQEKQEKSRIDAKVQNIEKARIKKIFKDQGDEVALFFSLKTLYRVQTVGGKIYNIKKDSTADEIAEMIKAS